VPDGALEYSHFGLAEELRRGADLVVRGAIVNKMPPRVHLARELANLVAAFRQGC
jgi:hypothetical protein